MDSKVDPQLVHEIVATRDSMGWNPTTMENVPSRLMCVVCELAELEEELSTSTGGHGAGGVVPERDWVQLRRRRELELADVAMYLITMLYDLCGGPVWGSRTVSRVSSPHAPPEVLTASVRSYVCGAMEHWRRVDSSTRESNVKLSLEMALLEVFRLGAVLDIHVLRAILTKIAILRERGPRNGGKHPDS